MPALLRAESHIGENSGQLLARAKEQHPHAFRSQFYRRSDLAVIESFDVGKPQQRLLLRLETGEQASHVLAQRLFIRHPFVKYSFQTPHSLPFQAPPVVYKQRRRGAVEIRSLLPVIETRGTGPEEAEKRLLKNVIGQSRIVCRATDVAAQHRPGVLIEGLESSFRNAIGKALGERSTLSHCRSGLSDLNRDGDAESHGPPPTGAAQSG